MIAVGVLMSWALIALAIAGVLIVWGVLNLIADMVDRTRQ